jgi:hypothetical protein
MNHSNHMDWTSSMPAASQTPEPSIFTCVPLATAVSRIASYAEVKPAFDKSKEYVPGLVGQAVVKALAVVMDTLVWVEVEMGDGCAKILFT